MKRAKTAVIGTALVLVVILNSGCFLLLFKGRDAVKSSTGSGASVQEKDDEERKKQ